MLVVYAVTFAVMLVVVLVHAFFTFFSKRGGRSVAKTSRDTTPAFDQFLRDMLEQELASRVVGWANSTAHERESLRRTLAGEPDPAVVGKIEEHVKSIDLEFVREANDADVEVTVRIQYESGRLAVRSHHLPLADVPANVRNELATKKTTQVLRPWSFPWQSPVEGAA